MNVPSSFGWVDFAAENQKKMLDVVKLFRKKDTVDELGIGSIRDSFSNYFFPGTSTIYTRAKYMLFIPWIYKKLEEKEITYPKIANRARKYEIKLIYALLDSEDTDGIIGGEAKESLKRLPSEIYWVGLESWGIRLHSGSKSQYHRSLTSRYYKKSKLDEGENYNWDLGLPKAPDNFLNSADIRLTGSEADYLDDRIACNHSDSLLFYLINNQIDSKPDFFWQLEIVNELPEKLKKFIRDARNFSETINGAFLYYNFLLAQDRGDKELISKYSNLLDNWIGIINQRWVELKTWYQNLDNFWSSPPLIRNNISVTTKSFVEQWYDIIFNSGLEDLKSNRDAKLLIKNRERNLKGKRARLHNPRALEMWGGRSGIGQLGYRWGTVKTIIADIVNGLQEGAIGDA